MSKRKSVRRRTNKSAASKRRRSAKPRKPSAPLSAADWVERASDLLVEHNVNGVEIANLCKRLGVTKGSFYWHFEGRGDLLSAILEDWRMRMTLNVNARLFRAGTPAPAVLHRLLGLIRKPRSDRNGAIERSVRDWARIDSLAREAVIEVDRTRLASFEALLRRCDFGDKQAHLRAYAAYAIMMGDSILKETVDQLYPSEDYIDAFVELLLSRKEQSKDAAGAPRKRESVQA